MPKGIKIDARGDMGAIRIDAESILSDLYELLDCTIVTPIEIHSGLVLWLDAEATPETHTLSAPLTATAAALGLDVDGHFGIYGSGVFLGGTATNPDTLSPDWRAQIVLKTINILINN